jgi:hypothetical protein
MESPAARSHPSSASESRSAGLAARALSFMGNSTTRLPGEPDLSLTPDCPLHEITQPGSMASIHGLGTSPG